MKAAIVVGHNAHRQGAHAGTPLNISEFDYWNQVADRMEALGGDDVKKFNRVTASSYGREIRQVYADVDAWGADISVELHFNAASPSATGSEVLCSGSSGSVRLCNHIQDAQLDYLHLRDRGVKVRGKSTRGGLSLHAGRAPAALVEPFFGSNHGDCEAAFNLGIEGMAEMYLAAIRRYK